MTKRRTVRTDAEYVLHFTTKGYTVAKLLPLCEHRHRTHEAAVKCVARLLEIGK